MRHIQMIEDLKMIDMLSINQAIEMHQAGPPQIKEVGLPLNAEMREAWNEVKRHKRRMRRTRAAEREVYRAAAAEKQENND